MSARGTCRCHPTWSAPTVATSTSKESRHEGDLSMEFIIAIFVVIGTLAVFEAAALAWGVDSREGLLDDRVH